MRRDRTGPDRHRHHRRPRWGLLAGGLAVTVSSLSVAPLASAPPAVAGGTLEVDRQSPAVVQEATEAIRSYRRYVRRGTPTSLRRYNRARNEAARATANAVRLDPRVVRRRWAAAGHRHQIAVLAALTQLGAEYRRYSSDPDVGFDCSGLTWWAWRRAGLTLPRSSGDQISAAAPRRRRTARAGDLVYYPGHVSLYLGAAGAIVHASDPEDDVELSYISRTVRWGDPTSVGGD
jgi:cell wall-associated NlpC family hydrolase